MISRRRLIHSLGVQTTAIKFARLYGVDRQKASIAGLVHDCARDLPRETLLEMVKRFHITVDELELGEPVLLHAPVGAELARVEFGIDDEEILNAIRVHTTGDVGMSMLDKIIYLADYVEPGRSYAGAGALKRLAIEDFDRALIAATDQTIMYVIRRGGLIHPRTVAARNSFLNSLAIRPCNQVIGGDTSDGEGPLTRCQSGRKSRER
ncbi:MAG TPA: HD domain-containing protein [Firmicutes bacterium]|nr:HD domain-containing protein [Bacillota bacterium]